MLFRWLLMLPLLTAMRLDPERIAERIRIEEAIDEERTGRGRRQLKETPEIHIQQTAPLFSSRLFDYGLEAGDNEVPQSLDVGKKLQLQRPINFYGEEHSTIYILSNGAIGFESSSRSYRAGIFPTGPKLIAPFWNRNDLRNGGHVYYREVTKGRVLERGQSEIRYQYDKSVNEIKSLAVKSAVIVTWEKMQPLGATALPGENTNTFQVALFMTDNGTFANFIYSNIGWTQAAEAGFNKGDGSEAYQLPTSGTADIMYLEENGNTGIPGEWMFELGKQSVIRCKTGIKGDTCDQECGFGEWGSDCSKCCHCADGTCNVLTGECKKQSCAECWTGANCQTKKENCNTRALVQCAANAISYTDYDRCGEPLQRCKCLSGFEGDGHKSCKDIDECSTKPRLCHEKAVCTNTPGRYFCQCQQGYSGDGITECEATFLYSSDSHQSLPKSKTAKVAWQLKNPLKIFGRSTDKLTITTSGLISLDDVARTSGEKLEDLRIQGIAPFFAPIDTSKGGHVTVAEVTDLPTLSRMARAVADHYDETSFYPTSALIVTYSNVTDGKSTRGNTFQTVLIGGSNDKRQKMTFVQLLYKDMPWGDGAEAGIMTNDISSSVSLPGSGTRGIEQLTQLSNVHQPGMWMYRIDEKSISSCPMDNQQPPYCDKQSAVDTQRTVQRPTHPPPSVISANLDSKKEDLTQRPIDVGGPRFITPTLINGPPRKGFESQRVPSQKKEDRIIQSNSGISNIPIERTDAVRSTVLPTSRSTRPRPTFGNTPHRPLVSIADEDFDGVPPDAFEVTFPPFMTVIPEVFRKESTPRPLPDFTVTHESPISTTITDDVTEATFPTFNDSDDTLTMMTTTMKPSDTTEGRRTTENNIEEVTESISMHSTDSENTVRKNQIQLEEGTPSLETTQNVADLSTIEQSVTEQQPPLFVFSTAKPTVKTTKKKPAQLVTAATTQRPEDPEAAASKLAIIIPTGIVAVWLLLLVVIALVVCCRKRSSTAHLRAMYGPTYGVHPTNYAAKRGSKQLDSSYEDHLEKAARLSSEMNTYNQSGRMSLYGSYWNLNNSPNSQPSNHTPNRHSPSYNGYTPSRYTYTGRY